MKKNPTAILRPLPMMPDRANALACDNGSHTSFQRRPIRIGFIEESEGHRRSVDPAAAQMAADEITAKAAATDARSK